MSDDRMRWWREARFGMMIHWGLYCLPAGDWNGRTMDFIGEWIMSKFRIPIAEYEQLAKQFNPISFDADEWVTLASRAGMKYLVFTAKHHDGFAMYHSHVDPYNIVDATPFGRDPVAELAQACESHAVKLCLYYSQALDWHEPDAGGIEAGHTNFGMSWCNDWDFPNNAEKRFPRYFEKKAKPQLKELLTRYGPIGAIWFDTPFTITRDQCQELYDLVRCLQPDCIMNSRLGQGLGDYASLGDNMIASGALEGYWETIATINDTWGYKRSDQNWKSTREILTLLTRSAARNVNYVLNVGPTSDGRFPEASVTVLRELGHWMEHNQEAIHSTSPSRFASDLPWGPVTHKTGRTYLHLHRWPGPTCAVHGLRNPVSKAYLLSRRDHHLRVRQSTQPGIGLHALEVAMPAAQPSEPVPVLALEFDGDAEVKKGAFQQADGSIVLPIQAARVHRSAPHDAHPESEKDRDEGGPQITPMGVRDWFSTDYWLSWTFQVFKPGRYQVKVISTGLHHSNPWRGGHRVRVRVAGAELIAVLNQDEEIAEVAARYYSQVASVCGEIAIDKPGRYDLTLRADEIKQHAGLAGDITSSYQVGLAVVSAQLAPVREG